MKLEASYGGVSSRPGLHEAMEDDEDLDDEDEEDAPTYEIEIRSVRVGSMRTIAFGPMFINYHGVCMRVKCNYN